MSVKPAAKVKWSRADRARHQAIREEFAHRPNQEELHQTGDFQGSIKSGAYFAVQSLVRDLKHIRTASRLTLADVANLTGIDEADLDLLETGRQSNPTVDTLWRYAHALGRRLVLDHSGKHVKVQVNGKAAKPRAKNT